MSKISKIEIVFPVKVELDDRFCMKLDNLLRGVCYQYEKENPNRVMWPIGHGCKPLTNPYMVDKDNPMEFDDEVYFVELYEREDLHGRNKNKGGFIPPNKIIY